MTLFAWAVLSWKCAWWVPAVPQLQPLLCRPELEVKLEESAAGAPTGAVIKVVHLTWDEAGQPRLKRGQVVWTPQVQ